MAFFHFCNCYLVCQNAINIWIYDDVAVVNIFVYQYLFMKLFGWGSVRFKNSTENLLFLLGRRSSSVHNISVPIHARAYTLPLPPDPFCPPKRTVFHPRNTHTSTRTYSYTPFTRISVCCDKIIYSNRK